MKEKYFFLKKIHPDKFIIFKTENQYITFEKDLEIARYKKRKHLFQNLENWQVSYLILDKELNILKSREFLNNQYRYILKRLFILKVIRGNYNEWYCNN